MIDELAKLAGDLANRSDGREVMLRRAVATAYYAAFHALCEMVASTLVGDEDRLLYVRVYRKTQHHHLDLSRRLFDISDKTRAVQTTLHDLRLRRIEADYDPNPFPRAQAEVADLILRAKDAIHTIRSFDEHERRALSINLLLGEAGEKGKKP